MFQISDDLCDILGHGFVTTVQ